MTGDLTPAADDPRAPGWGGLLWSGWLDFDKAHGGHLIPRPRASTGSGCEASRACCTSARAGDGQGGAGAWAVSRGA
jgi:hypothetical protein